MSFSPIELADRQLARLKHFTAAADSPPQDLLEVLGRIPDARDWSGIRYALSPVLAVAVCATLAGARS